ncbi:tetratricopeptide repeat protein [Cobetia marina]
MTLMKNILKKAEACFQEKKYSQVDDLLIDVLKIDQVSINAWRLYVKVELDQKNWNSAYNRVREALNSRPDEPILYILKANIERNLGNKCSAVICLRYALARWPNHRGIQSEILLTWQSQGEKLIAFPLLKSLKNQLTELPLNLIMASARFFYPIGDS